MGKMRVVEVTNNNHVNEVVDDADEVNTNAEAVEEKEVNFPHPIKLRTKANGAIVLLAERKNRYKKYYFSDYDSCETVGVNPYRVKHVMLPVNRDGKIFSDVWALFRHLRDNCGYVKTL